MKIITVWEEYQNHTNHYIQVFWMLSIIQHLEYHLHLDNEELEAFDICKYPHLTILDRKIRIRRKALEEHQRKATYILDLSFWNVEFQNFLVGNLNLMIHNLSHGQHRPSNQFQDTKYNWIVILYVLRFLNLQLNLCYYILMELNKAMLEHERYVGMYNP